MRDRRFLIISKHYFVWLETSGHRRNYGFIPQKILLQNISLREAPLRNYTSATRSPHFCLTSSLEVYKWPHVPPPDWIADVHIAQNARCDVNGKKVSSLSLSLPHARDRLPKQAVGSSRSSTLSAGSITGCALWCPHVRAWSGSAAQKR